MRTYTPSSCESLFKLLVSDSIKSTAIASIDGSIRKVPIARFKSITKIVVILCVVLFARVELWAATPLRALIFGPSTWSSSAIQAYINATSTFAPIGTGSTSSQIWSEGTWLAKSTADFATFDVIIFDDCPANLGLPDSGSMWAAATANSTIWASAVTGNIMIIAEDPAQDNLQTYWQPSLEFAVDQTGYSQHVTGLLFLTGDPLGSYSGWGTTFEDFVTSAPPLRAPIPDGVPVLSGFGNFSWALNFRRRSVLKVAGQPKLNPIGETDITANGESSLVTFFSWPSGFVPWIIKRDARPLEGTPNYTSPFASYKDGFGDSAQLGIEPAVVGLIRGNNIRQLLVTPMQTLPNGTATLNISLKNQPANTAVVGKLVQFQVNGISTITGSATTSASGTATWTYTRSTVSTPGRDVVTVYVDDLPANAIFDPAEDSAIAYVNWGNPIVTVTAIDATASEPGSNTGTIRFSRTGLTTSSLTVRFLRLGGAQTENPNNSPDYLFSSQVQVKSVPEANQAYVTIPAGQASVDVTITPTDDSIPELTEAAIFLIMDPDGGSINYSVGLPYQATVSITDNEPPPVVTISSAAPLGDAAASEAGLDTGTFKIIRTGSLGQNLIVRFSLPTVSGSAFYGSDYLLQYYDTDSSSLQNLYDGNGVFIRTGYDTVLVYVQPLQDSRNEGPETVTMSLKPDSYYVVGSPGSASVTIADNDTVTLPLSYTITEIGGYPGNPSHAYAIDNSSPPKVVGDWVPNPSPSAARPYRYQNGTITDLGLYGGSWTFEYALAYAINGSGVVVGYGKYSPVYPYRGPVYWNPTITAIDASTGEQGPQAALGINNAGNIVGYLQRQISPGEKQGHAFYWPGPSSAREDLGVLAGTLSGKSSYATAINNNSMVVGTSMTDYSASGFHGFRLDRSAATTLVPLNDIGTLLGVDQTSSECTAINDLNEAVGGSTAAGPGQYHAFWKAANAPKNSGFVDLGTLAGDNYSVALGINGIGHIVGTSKKTTSPTSQRAFVSYNNGQRVDLITKVSNPTGWTLLTAQGINTAGYIVGYGLKNGAERGYLLAPSN